MAQDSLFVRLPLSPKIVRALRAHAETVAEAARLLQSTSESVSALLEVCERAGVELGRDVERVRRAVKGRKRR
jgi:hypothetical protein